MNLSDSSSQAITSVSSLNQTNVAQYGSSYIDPFPEPVSGEQRSLPSLSTLPLDNLRSPDLFNVVNGNTLIGTTSERQILINDIQNSFVESLHADIDKERENHVEERRREEQTKMSEDATRLMNERKNRVLPEPNMDEDVTSLSVRHPALGTTGRLFNKEVTMNSCYDWVGSLREQPMYSNLIDPSGAFVSASSKVVEYGHLVLNVQITEKPPNFEEDGEVTVQGFSVQVTNNDLTNN